jgi:hypothetical protein
VTEPRPDRPLGEHASLSPKAAEALDRIEEARSEAAAYAVQRPEDRDRISGEEERIVDAVQAAEQTPVSADDRLTGLAEEAESARDAIRDQVHGRVDEA